MPDPKLPDDGDPTDGLDLPLDIPTGAGSEPIPNPEPMPNVGAPVGDDLLPSEPVSIETVASTSGRTPEQEIRRKRLKDAASWLIPVAALGLGLGFRCVRQPIFVEPPSVAGGVAPVQPGQIVSLGLFPRPEGKRTVHITGVHLSHATKGLQIVKAVGANLKEGRPVIPGRVGEPEKSHPLDKVVFQAGNFNYLVIEVKADKPGSYTAKGVNIDYTSGVQRGTHHMKVTVGLTVAPKK